jgi:hypothetical protein
MGIVTAWRTEIEEGVAGNGQVRRQISLGSLRGCRAEQEYRGANANRYSAIHGCDSTR